MASKARKDPLPTKNMPTGSKKSLATVRSGSHVVERRIRNHGALEIEALGRKTVALTGGIVF